MPRSSVSFLLLPLILASGCVSETARGQTSVSSSLPRDQVAGIDAVFAEMNATDVPGCAVGVVQEGELVFGRGYGMANLEHGIPLDTRSILRMGSVGNQFTAGTVALLALDGAIELDEDIRTYLPELPDFGEPVTVQQLIHHTSGYRDYLTFVSLVGAREEDYYDDPELYRLLTRQEELNFPPPPGTLRRNGTAPATRGLQSTTMPGPATSPEPGPGSGIPSTAPSGW